MDDEGAPGSERGERASDEQDAAGSKDSDDLRARVGGIGEWTDEIEDGAEAKRATERTEGFHGRVIERREEEDEACFAKTLDSQLRREFNGHAESFENIGGAAARSDGAVAMLGDVGAGSGSNERCTTRNVEGLWAAASGTDAVDEFRSFRFGKGQWDCVQAHDVHKARQFGCLLAARGEDCQQRGRLHLWHAAGEDLLENAGRLLTCERGAVLGQWAKQVLHQRHERSIAEPGWRGEEARRDAKAAFVWSKARGFVEALIRSLRVLNSHGTLQQWSPMRLKCVWDRFDSARILRGNLRFGRGLYPLKIHEYQAKGILAKYGVAVPKGEEAATFEDAAAVVRKLFADGAPGVVVKAQIHAGGRGKGGGVKVAKTREDAELHSKNILGMTLVTHQTGPQGQKVQRLLIEETAAIERELYLGIVLDRNEGKLVFMASQAGGMEIEEVAAKTPEAIFKETIDPAVGFGAWQARKLAFALGLEPTQINHAVTFFQSLYKAFTEADASLLEINPFISTTDGGLFALDAKMTFDDNALFRHPDIKALRDVAEEDPLEVEASKYALNYIKLDGTIACMVNGAGLAMATMDIIQYAGGSPANFLDVGGGATQEQIEHAFEILLSDKNVRAIFINIFGGILRVDRLATGVVAAARNLHVKVPIVLRLEGTNVEEGRKILKESGLNFQVGATMKEAAEMVVAAAAGA